jgi:cytochrome c oxidase subunit 1
MTICLLGGVILVSSAVLFLVNLASFHIKARHPEPVAPIQYAVALHPGTPAPAALNGFRLWNALVLVIMTAAYAFPIAQSFLVKAPQAVVHRVDRTN